METENGKRLPMDEGEICRSYREAKDPKKQVRVLAELNLCTPAEIADILSRGGAMSNQQAGAYRRRPRAEAAPVQPANTPAQPDNTLPVGPFLVLFDEEEALGLLREVTEGLCGIEAVCAACAIQHLRRYGRERDPEELRQAMRALCCLMRERGEPAE